METFEANLIAAGGHAKAVRLALLRLGMRRCSLQLVDRQCRSPKICLDWYGLFWRWLQALFVANRAGAEFLLDDLLLRFARLRESNPAPTEDVRAQLVRCQAEHGDCVTAAYMNDLERLRRETLEHMAEERRLVAMIDAELSGASRAA